MKFTNDKNDLKKDQVYNCFYNGNRYLFKPKRDGANECHYIRINGTKATDRGSSGGFGSLVSNSGLTELTVASADEAHWLELCIIAKGKMDKPTIGNAYEVY